MQRSRKISPAYPFPYIHLHHFHRPPTTVIIVVISPFAIAVSPLATDPFFCQPPGHRQPVDTPPQLSSPCENGGLERYVFRQRDKEIRVTIEGEMPILKTPDGVTTTADLGQCFYGC
ncbi:hypothetical protein LXL04_027765 [Taraxacum kok-saghyz]